MKDDTDVKARFEFNMGLDDNDVWIDNVKLIKTEDAPVIDPSEIARPPLLSGNYIYNGTFDQGPNRMGFWNFVVDSTAFETRIEKGGTSRGAIRLVQPGINIEKKHTRLASKPVRQIQELLRFLRQLLK